MSHLLPKLRADFPQFQFAAGPIFSWSARQQKITYRTEVSDSQQAAWSLLHELGHALLQHNTYKSDFELVKLEADAWEQAATLAQKYDCQIDPEHIQDCLDTYRDWLHQRSTCPTCQTNSLQSDLDTYCCYNCNTLWKVSRSRLCRPYRSKQKETAGL